MKPPVLSDSSIELQFQNDDFFFSKILLTDDSNRLSFATFPVSYFFIYFFFQIKMIDSL